MRLTPYQRKAIPEILRRHFGDRAEVRLFGSRVDDSARGGDIDLYVEPEMTDPDALIEAKLQALAELHQRLGEQKIDLIIKRAGTATKAIHRVAKSSGLPL
jgi:predicted nucleotidyltransferase